MSKVAAILRADAEVYERKARDYAPDPAHPFENFEFASDFAGRFLGGKCPEATACVVLIGVKISRLMTLGAQREASNEGIVDTLRDLRVYLAILEAMLGNDGRG